MKKLLILTSLLMGFSLPSWAADNTGYEDSDSSTYSEEAPTTETTEQPQPVARPADESSATGATAPASTTESRTAADNQDEGKKRDSGGFYLEPFIFGSQSEGAIEASGLGAIDSTSDIREGGLGLRIGGHIGEVVLISADARYGRAGLSNSFYENADSDHYNYGLMLGAQTPWAGIRVWATRILGGEFNPNAGANNLDVKFGGATGYRVGAGFHVAAVSLNLEYQDLSYGDTDVESPGTTTISNIDASQKGYTVSLGFPLEF